MKIKAKYFKEIEYVEVKDLPQDQQSLLLAFREADYIKILIDGTIVGPCLQYSQYSAWYAQNFVNKETTKPVQNELSVKTFVLNKAG